jgi:hypothetical protein
MCQHLEDFCNSVDQYRSDNQWMMLKNYTPVKRPIQSTMEVERFKISECKIFMTCQIPHCSSPLRR